MSFLNELLGIQAPDEPVTPPVAMTIAGSDSGGGAGIQADLKTFAAAKVHGTSVLTLITAQNTQGVTALEMLPAPLIRAQFDAVVSDLAPVAAKTGALGSEVVIGTVVELLEERPMDLLVVDPVMVSKHGAPLLPDAAVRAVREKLMPHALLVTPNRHEAEALVGRSVGDLASMKEACKRIFDLGARNVLIKGSHMDRIVRDIVYDGSGFVEFGADRVDSRRVHGSGCTFSAMITARLAHGDDLLDAVAAAREFITGAIARAPKLGEGISPVHPMFELWG